MIYIEQHQAFPENENIKVLSPTGNYNDMDLIEYYSVEQPGVAQGAYHAQFIKYGGIVYRFSDPKELGAEILKIDPESTHSAASFVRMQNELLKQFDQGSLEPNSLNQALETEQTKMEESVSDTLQDTVSENTEPTPPPLTNFDTPTINTEINPPLVDSGDISTTTPPVIIPDTTETPADVSKILTDPAIVPETESVAPESETSSTASEILSYAKKTIRKNIAKKIKKGLLG